MKRLSSKSDSSHRVNIKQEIMASAGSGHWLSAMLVNIKQAVAGERGAVLVLVAAAMVALLGFVALVTDLGLIYVQRTRLTNAADAAALAGVQELPGAPGEAEFVAREYAVKNGVDPGELEIGVAADNRSLTVRPRRNVKLLFARVLGIYDQDVEASATASVAALSGAAGTAPFSIQEQQLEYGWEYVLKVGGGDGETGWFRVLDLDGDRGGGADEYEQYVKYGYQGMIRVGDVIPVETGNMSGKTSKGVQYRIDLCEDGCTFENFKRDCSRVIIVPVVKRLGGKGADQSVEIRGFAAFFLEGVKGQGNDSEVTGRFVRTVYPGEAGSGEGYGVQAVRLIR